MANLLNQIWTLLLRIALTLFALVMFFGVMVVGALASVVLIAWALLRGRRAAPINFAWKGPGDWRSRGQAARPGRRAEPEVVDIEAREVDPASAKPKAEAQTHSDRAPD